MGEVTRHIGLSLGADICWPICYEALLRQLNLRVPLGGDTLRFEVERVSIEPFDLQQSVKYDVVIDRLTHWYNPTREWIKKAIVLNDVYVFNNPWSLQSMEKQTTYCAMMRLGMPVPRTWMLPPKAYEPSDDLEPTLRQYARMFDLGDVGKQLGYPMFLKPYSGGGWVGVTRIDDEAGLRAAYEESGKLVMNLQSAVDPHDNFVRCVGLGPQVRIVKYHPSAPLHDRYGLERDFVEADDVTELTQMGLTINSFFGWDFNSAEMLRREGSWHPIDFANACPDSQVTSLHYHFPWLIKANLRWSIFAAATQRKMHHPLDWQPFYRVAADDGLSYRDKLAAYAAIAHERFETGRFAEFCEQHLGHLDELAYEFFGSETLRDAVNQKVKALFPAHEVDEFTDCFFDRIQSWRTNEGERPGSADIALPA